MVIVVTFYSLEDFVKEKTSFSEKRPKTAQKSGFWALFLLSDKRFHTKNTK